VRNKTQSTISFTVLYFSVKKYIKYIKHTTCFGYIAETCSVFYVVYVLLTLKYKIGNEVVLCACFVLRTVFSSKRCTFI
jgi:hypothetical protein